MEAATKKRTLAPVEIVLIILAVLAAAALCVTLVMAIPHMRPEEVDEDPLSLNIRQTEDSFPIPSERSPPARPCLRRRPIPMTGTIFSTMKTTI